ncbi:hypothetical protein CRYUN_Cryun28dG0027400 [Craigia yunnanensis]
MVVRDYQGISHLCAATKVDNIDSALHAKLKAILFGLEEASNFHFPFLTLESDSLLAVKEIEKQQESFCEWECIIYDIIGLSFEFQSCSFYHIRITANTCAHNLDRLATELGDYKVSFCNPDNV